MSRWLRLLIAFVAAMFRGRMKLQDESRIQFRVWPNEVDLTIMNHAPLMTAMEAGRVDVMVRTGFLKMAAKKKWYFPTSAINVRFARPLKVFQEATVTTKVIFIDESWIYLEHRVERNGKEVASAIVKCAVKKGRERVAYQEVIKELDLGSLPKERPPILSIIEDDMC